MKERSHPGFPAVVVGGSAGAIDPLRKFVSEVPAEFPAAIFIANHVPPDSVSALPHLLARAGALFATHAIDNAPIAPGQIIVAPPDHHLMVEDGVMRVSQGPMENNQRPSIDVLFRSAAMNFKSATCGILLSGTLDDGSAGIVAIHEAGGATFVQEPDDAQFPDMPLNAMATGAVDGAYPADRLYDAVRDWLRHPARAPQIEQVRWDERDAGKPSVFTCPDCGGTLWELEGRGVLRFRCRTGHAYNPSSMLSAYDGKLEAVLWASIRALQERRDLLRRMSRRSLQSSQQSSRRRYEQQAAEVEADIERLHAVLASFSSATTPA
ncbi:MAG TPA: chemotaxis protein CheB [Candidatus Cybelea sp.]|nr:chemotaxis protein CheB [Candidatus Cybelea sp.]